MYDISAKQKDYFVSGFRKVLQQCGEFQNSISIDIEFFCSGQIPVQSQ